MLWIPIAAFFDYERRLEGLELGAIATTLLAYAAVPLAVVLATRCVLLLSWRRARSLEIGAGTIVCQVLGAGLIWTSFMMIAAAVPTMLGEEEWAAPLGWLLAALPVAMVGVLLSRSGHYLAPFELTEGPLRDRAFELAKQCGIALQRIYLLPAQHLGFANAFALSGDQVIVTDVLVNELTRREVDAVVAHELSHLEHRHPTAISTVVVTGMVIVFLVSGQLSVVAWNSLSSLPLDETWQDALARLPFWWLAVPLVILGLYFVTRRFERTADAHAAALTGDPAALISALGKLGPARSTAPRSRFLLGHRLEPPRDPRSRARHWPPPFHALRAR